MEKVTGEFLEDMGQERAVQPLGMEHSSFVNTPAVMGQPAQGHLPTLLPALVFAVPFLVVLLLLALLALVAARLRSGRWRISRPGVLAIEIAHRSLGGGIDGIQRHGCGGMLGVFWRMLVFCARNPDCREFVKGVRKEGVTPENPGEYFG